jgi:hypothetical protein
LEKSKISFFLSLKFLLAIIKMSASDNSAILASALTSLTGSQIITQSDYLRRNLLNGNNATYLNINPVSLHNSYLVGGAVSNIPQQNINEDSDSLLSCNHENGNNNQFGNVNQQQYFYVPNSQVVSRPSSPQSLFSHPCSSNCTTCSASITKPNNSIMPSRQQTQPQVFYPQQIQQVQQIQQIQQQKQIITINISTLNGQIISINNVPIITKISVIKLHIERITRIPSNKQRLIYSGILLQDNLTLLNYNILNSNSTIYLIGQILNDVIGFIDSTFLDPAYDCDFTNVRDFRRFIRGSHIYRRPCGWKRIAIKVLNKYGPDNTWLGTARKGSWRYDSDPMEWPVSYHGTDKFNAKSIAETGFDVTKGKRFRFGYGIYSTPDINIAALYASRFIHNNEVYCLVFQNRVNPNTLVTINTNIGEYWISPKSEDIRPYGICIKKLGQTQAC